MSADTPVTPDDLTREPTDISPTEFDDGPTPKQLAREARAATEHLLVDTVTPETDETGLVHVYSTEGKQYVVDLESGACSCPDAEYNLNVEHGERCKHAVRAEIVTGRRGLPPVDVEAVDDRLRERLDG